MVGSICNCIQYFEISNSAQFEPVWWFSHAVSLNSASEHKYDKGCCSEVDEPSSPEDRGEGG